MNFFLRIKALWRETCAREVQQHTSSNAVKADKEQMDSLIN
jgi:hypothetical protein